MEIPTIKEIRAFAGLSQSAFCKAFWIPKRTLQAWEEGQRECPLYTRRLLAIVTGMVKKSSVK